MKIRQSLFAAVLCASAALAVQGAIPSVTEFGNGPAKWLMTREDQQAWSKVHTAEEARDYVDLFWARRDPTPGTPRNEFREEFDSRVAYADIRFKPNSGKRRGALTDMGRVYIILGAPSNLVGEGSNGFNKALVGTTDSVHDSNGDNPSTMGHLGAKSTFEYANYREIGLSGPVFFVENVVGTGDLTLDPQKANVSGALATAIRKAIVSPDLKEVPAWAREPEIAFAQTGSPESRPTATVSRTVTHTVIVPDKPRTFDVPKGLRRFVLTGSSDSLRDPQTTDPFGGITSTSSFKSSNELGYAYEYCSPNLDPSNPPTLNASIRISGLIAGQKVNMNAPADQVVPEPIRSMPGCGVVRGSIPLSDMKPGNYAFTITVEDPTTHESFNSRQEFKVE